MEEVGIVQPEVKKDEEGTSTAFNRRLRAGGGCARRSLSEGAASI